VQQGIDSYHTALSGQSDRTLSKWPIVFAGMLLNHNGMRTVSYGGFREVWQTYYGGPGWTGATVLFRVKVGMEHEHLHPTAWGNNVVEGMPGQKREQYRRGSASWIWVGSTLAMRRMNAEPHFNHAAYFDYVDRWMNEP